MNNKRFKRNNLLIAFTRDLIIMTEAEIKEDYSASDLDIRKLKTLANYFYYLQYKKITFSKFSNFSKKEYDNFKSNRNFCVIMSEILQ